MENSIKTDTEFEKLKLIYESSLDLYKYFLSWRRYLLTGIFTVQSALLICCYYLYSSRDEFLKVIAPCPALMMPLVSIIFILFESRNKILYQACQKAGAKIEKEFFPNLHPNEYPTKAVFFNLDESIKANYNQLSHSVTMNITFGVLGGIGIVIAIVLFKL